MSNINISVTEQDPINVSIASPEVQNVDVSGQSISATVTDGDKGDIIVTGNGTVWTLDTNALATRVPYTGATSDVNLGEFGLLTGNLEFDTTPTNIPTGAGSLVWNDTDGTLDLTLKGGNVVLPIGQRQTVRAVNGTASNLTRAQYRVVKVIGAQGQRLQVGLAQANNDANSKDTIGIVAEDINNNQTGFFVTSGLIESINTTGSLQSETWADGDTLYLSGTTPGVITNIKPAAPTHTVILGFVVYAHQNNGKIYVKVDNGYELDELHNVNVSTAGSGDYLRYNGTTWVDSTISAADLPSAIDAAKIGSGLVSNTEFGYLDGVTSAIQTQLNAKEGTITAGTTAQYYRGDKTFQTLNTTAVTEGTNLYYTDARARAAITLTTTGTSGAATYSGGTLNIPQYQAVLTNPVTGTGTTNYLPTFSSSNSIGNSSIIANGASLGINTTTTVAAGNTSIRFNSPSGGQNVIRFAVNEVNICEVTGDVSNGLSLYTYSGRPMLFYTGGTLRATINAAGRLLVNTTTDAGYLADFNGTGRFTSTLTIQAGSGNPALNIDGYNLLSWNNGTEISFGGYSGTTWTHLKLFAGGNEITRIVANGIGLGQTTFGTSATKTLAVGNGTAPSTSPADAFQMYSNDITAGNAAAHFRTEGGAVIKLYQQTTGVGAATRVGGGGTTVTDTDTFDGYTINQIVKALRNAGFLA